VRDSGTFAEILDRQVHGIDIFNPSIESEARSKLLQYLDEFLQVGSFCLFRASPANGQPGLIPDEVWRSADGQGLLRTLQRKSGEYRDLPSWCLGEDRPLWILEREGALVHERRYDNCWYRVSRSQRDSLASRLPPYTRDRSQEEQALAIVPVARPSAPGQRTQPEAVARFGFRRLVFPTEALKAELTLIANIVLRLDLWTKSSERERAFTLDCFSAPGPTPRAIRDLLLANDVLNDRIFEAAKNRIDECCEALGVSFRAYHRCEEVIIEEQPEIALYPCTTWASGWRDRPLSLLDDSVSTIAATHASGEVRFRTQVGYAFEHMRQIAVQPMNAKNLDEAEAYRELGASVASPEIPSYIANANERSTLSVLCPVFMGVNRTGTKEERLGVVNFEFAEAEHVTPNVLTELQDLADSISRLQRRKEASEQKRKGSMASLKNLKCFLSPKLRFSQRAFFAYPEKADPAVLSLVSGVIEQLQSRTDQSIELVAWAEAKRPGNFSTNLWKELSSCDLLIAYLSEPSAKSYTDNANVLIESAFFKGNCYGQERVLLLREASSRKRIASDFGTEQLIYIKRDSDEQIDGAHLERELVRLAANVLGIDIERTSH